MLSHHHAGLHVDVVRGRELVLKRIAGHFLGREHMPLGNQPAKAGTRQRQPPRHPRIALGPAAGEIFLD
jgi:hypothetical protein